MLAVVGEMEMETEDWTGPPGAVVLEAVPQAASAVAAEIRNRKMENRLGVAGRCWGLCREDIEDSLAREEVGGNWTGGQIWGRGSLVGEVREMTGFLFCE